MPVNFHRKDYTAMLPKWARLRDCYGGRDKILAAGTKYTPLIAGDTEHNKVYRERGNFYNAVKRTVNGMNGSIFQTAPAANVPSAFADLLTDITLTNIPLETFATEIGREIFLVGRHGVLVDMPKADSRPGADMRPYCVSYAAEDIVNWRVERRGGDEVLTLVVLKEQVEEPDPNDLFKLDCIEQYRVVYLRDNICFQQVWKPKSKGSNEYVLVSEDMIMRRGEPLTSIPFVFFSPLKANAELEEPPLTDLADINLGHWRNSVDHEYGLHLVALPTPYVAGAKGGSDGEVRQIGPSVVWELDVNGSAGMLEFAGTGLGALVIAMAEKKKQMAVQGARLLEDSATVQETAEAVRLRHSGEGASLKTVAQSIEMGLTLLLQWCVWWQGVEKLVSDVKVSVTVNKEFLNIRATAQDIQTALTALQAGEISYATWYDLLTRGRWSREGVTVEDERKEIEKDRKRDPEPTVDPEADPNNNPDVDPGKKKEEEE